MTWVQLDDGFDEHPKILGLSDAAFRLHVRAICYSNRRLTDGRVPSAFVRGKLPAELMAAGCWEKNADGWVLHDYLDWNRSAEQVAAERQKARDRRQKGAKHSADVRATEARHSPDVQVPTPLHSTTPPSEVQDPELKAPNGAHSNGHSTLAAALLTSDSTAQYLISRMSESWQLALTSGALLKLGKEYGAPVVIDALRNMREEDVAPEDPYPYFKSVCIRIAGLP